MKTSAVLVSLFGLSLFATLTAGAIAPITAAPARLSESQVVEQLRRLPTWTMSNGVLTCTYQFENFVEAIAFVNRLVPSAEAAAHHPDLAIAYNKVTIHLTTHDAGGLTLLDFDLAERISQLRENDSGCINPGGS